MNRVFGGDFYNHQVLTEQLGVKALSAGTSQDFITIVDNVSLFIQKAQHSLTFNPHD